MASKAREIANAVRRNKRERGTQRSDPYVAAHGVSIERALRDAQRPN